MNTSQLLNLLYTNRELIQRNNLHAVEHLQMLQKDYTHVADEEVVLNIELNKSLAEWHFYSRHNSAIENSLRIVAKYSTTKYQNMLARHYWLIGFCYGNKGEYESAKKYLLLALLHVTPNEQGFVTIKSDVLTALAMNEEIISGDHQRAIEYLEQALPILKDTGYDIYLANTLMGLGNVHINTENISEALKYYQQALEIYERHFDLANMASAYSNIGTCYIESEEYAQAEKYLEKSLEMRMKFGTPQQLCISYYNLAIVYKNTNQKQRAYETILKCKEILEKADNEHFLVEAEDLLKLIGEEIKNEQLITV